MALKLNNKTGVNPNETNNNPITMKEEEDTGRKLFANKAANRALIIAGAIIAVVIVGLVIFVNIPI